MTRVVLHLTVGVADPEVPASWDAWIEGIAEPFPVLTLTDLNTRLTELHVTETSIFGAAGCQTVTCPLVSTGVVITNGPDSYRLTQACDSHRLISTIAGDYPSALIEGVIPCRRVYRRWSGSDMADLIRTLVRHPVPDPVLSQPACKTCRCLLMPGMFAQLTWLDADGNGTCGKRKNSSHTATETECAAVIAQHVAEFNAMLAADDMSMAS